MDSSGHQGIERHWIVASLIVWLKRQIDKLQPSESGSRDALFQKLSGFNPGEHGGNQSCLSHSCRAADSKAFALVNRLIQASALSLAVERHGGHIY